MNFALMIRMSLGNGANGMGVGKKLDIMANSMFKQFEEDVRSAVKLQFVQRGLRLEENA